MNSCSNASCFFKYSKYLSLCGIMPRDLFSSDAKDDSLVASPESQTPKPEGAELASANNNDGYPEFTIHRDESSEPSVRQFPRTQAKDNDNLHPYVQTLSISDLESCVALENASFPEHERCSREKVVALPKFCSSLFQEIASPR